MTAIHGKLTGMLIGGDNPTGFLRELGVTSSADTAEATPFMVQDKQYVVGQSDATVSMGGMYEGSLDAATRIFEAIQDGSAGYPFVAVFGGWLAGNRCRMGTTLRTQFDISSPVADIVSVSGSLQSTSGVRGGVLLKPLAATAAHNNVAAYGPAVDLGAAPAYSTGTRLQIHVVANSLNTSAFVVLQHSADGVTWVDVITRSVAPGQTVGYTDNMQAIVQRYVRLASTGSATAGSITFTAALARV